MCQTARRPANASSRNGTGAVCASARMPTPMMKIHIPPLRPRKLLARVGDLVAVEIAVAPVFEEAPVIRGRLVAFAPTGRQLAEKVKASDELDRVREPHGLRIDHE